MKSIRGFALGLTLGVAVAIATVGFAQTTQPTNPSNQKAEAGAMMSCCCCHGGSCAMHNGEGHSEAQMKEHPKMQGDKMKQHSAEGGCCCCGDSCDMQMKMKETEKTKQE